MNSTLRFSQGVRAGLPICLGYIPVAFTFGFIAVSGGLPVWAAIIISLTNLTSAGQFAGTNLIIAGAGCVEIGLTTLIINLRYMLMSLSLPQKIDPEIPLWQRLIFGFGITDETFVVSSMEPKVLNFAYLTGLILPPILGWNLGTVLGGCISTLLPIRLQNAMGIALYAMFIALIIPAARKSRQMLLVILLAVLIMCLLRYLPGFSMISSGFRIIITTILAAGAGAVAFPIKEEDNPNEQ